MQYKCSLPRGTPMRGVCPLLVLLALHFRVTGGSRASPSAGGLTQLAELLRILHCRDDGMSSPLWA